MCLILSETEKTPKGVGLCLWAPLTWECLRSKQYIQVWGRMSQHMHQRGSLLHQETQVLEQERNKLTFFFFSFWCSHSWTLEFSSRAPGRTRARSEKSDKDGTEKQVGIIRLKKNEPNEDTTIIFKYLESCHVEGWDSVDPTLTSRPGAHGGTFWVRDRFRFGFGFGFGFTHSANSHSHSHSHQRLSGPPQ